MPPPTYKPPVKMRKKGRPVTPKVWTEEELLNGKRAQCLVMVLKTSGCRWWRENGGCLMCGYNRESSDSSIGEEEVRRQFEGAWNSLEAHSIVKIYTSGSFLDECEVSGSIREEILRRSQDAGIKLVVESRPEFVTREAVSRCVDLCSDFELALGLESANDKVLSRSIQKGFSYADYVRAATDGADAGAAIRTYLLLKPPYLTEEEAIADALNSISMVSRYSRVISINPTNVQRHTHVERLWKRWAFRPPWLWSVVEVLKAAEIESLTLISSLAGAGHDRGPHNCSKCDPDVIAAIDGFNLTQDRRKLELDDCPCKGRWLRNLSSEKFAISPGNHERFFTRYA